MAMDSTALFAQVASADQFPPSPQFRLRVENEIMLVTAVVGRVFSVQRGAENTVVTSHSAGTRVIHILTAGAIAKLVQDFQVNVSISIPPLVGVKGSVLVEDPIGNVIWRRLHLSDLDPDFSVSSFSLGSPAPGLYERGQAVLAGASPNASISYVSGPPSIVTLTNVYGGSSGVGDVSLGSWTSSSPYSTANVTGSVQRFGVDHSADPSLIVRLSATSGSINSVVDQTLTWTSKVYWGVGGPGFSTNTQVIGLSSELHQDKFRNFTVSPTNQKVYFATPVDYGMASFKLGGFDASFNSPTTVNVTNSQGVTRAYYIYESQYLLTGTNLTFVVS